MGKGGSNSIKKSSCKHYSSHGRVPECLTSTHNYFIYSDIAAENPGGKNNNTISWQRKITYRMGLRPCELVFGEGRG